MDRYEEGDQPCEDYDPEDGSMPGVRNRHSCYGGGIGGWCPFSVSWCRKCKRDHHEGGWENCPARLRARVKALEEALELVLPLAKGYAAAHPVGSNARYIEIADSAIAEAPK